MKKLIYALIAILTVTAAPVAAQTVANTTTLSAAIDANVTTFRVASTSNITVTSTANSTGLFIPQTGEYMQVLSVPASGTVTVRRGISPTRPYAAPSSATVIIVTSPDMLIAYDPAGACTRGSGLARYSPVLNLATGMVWVCRSSLWQGTSLTLSTYNSIAPFTP